MKLEQIAEMMVMLNENFGTEHARIHVSPKVFDEIKHYNGDCTAKVELDIIFESMIMIYHAGVTLTIYRF